MAENLNFFYYTSQIMIFIELPIVFFVRLCNIFGIHALVA